MDTKAQKDILRFGALIVITIISIMMVWQSRGEEPPDSSENHPFEVPKDHAPNSQFSPLPFHEDPEILKAIRDDQYLEREGFYYLLHQMLATDEKGVEALVDDSLRWEILNDASQREKIRGKVMRIEGVLADLQPFRVGKSGECYVFQEDDFRDFKNLLIHLRDADYPLSLYLYNRFSHNTREMLDSYNALSEEPPPALQKSLIYEFNRVLEDTCFYEPERFAKVDLSDHLRRLVESHPQEDDLLRANRMLLEEVYPQIKKSHYAEERGIKDFPVWLGLIYSDYNQYLVIFPEVPKDIRQQDRVEIFASYMKQLIYENQRREVRRSHVFIGKKLRFLSHYRPYISKSVSWLVVAILAIFAVFLAAAIFHDHRERRNFRKRHSTP